MPAETGYEIVRTDRKTDARGALAEIVRNVPGGSQVYVFTVAAGQSRGGHWHRHKEEWFACVAGKATLVLRTDEGAGEPREVCLPGDFSLVVRVRPGTLHTFRSAEGATVVGCISESFDPSEPDTYFPG